MNSEELCKGTLWRDPGRAQCEEHAFGENKPNYICEMAGCVSPANSQEENVGVPILTPGVTLPHRRLVQTPLPRDGGSVSSWKCSQDQLSLSG